MQKRQVIVVVYDHCLVLDVSGPVEVFEKANDALAEACYDITIVAAKAGKVETSGALDTLTFVHHYDQSIIGVKSKWK